MLFVTFDVTGILYTFVKIKPFKTKLHVDICKYEDRTHFARTITTLILVKHFSRTFSLHQL